MGIDFYSYLKEGLEIRNMPPIEISSRSTDKSVIYDKNTTRLDRIAGDIYGRETLWRPILWGNPEYTYEFDIPDGTVIRVPFPIEDVLQEIVEQLVKKE